MTGNETGTQVGSAIFTCLLLIPISWYVRKMHSGRANYEDLGH